MAQVGNSAQRFGGEFMVQDSDHMAGIDQPSEKANRGSARQVEQSTSGGRQQGGNDQHGSAQQGSERRSDRTRHAH